MRNRGGRNVPDGWRNMSSIGEPIPETRFIVFKTPLDWRAEWNLETLKRKVPTMRNVIDLTRVNPGRYYSPGDCVAMGINHRRIPLQGVGAIPSEDDVELFFATVQEFLDAIGDDDDGLIGVHSTDGVNRPGVLLCRYMIEMMEMDPEEAITAFQTSRGENIDEPRLLDYLHHREWEN